MPAAESWSLSPDCARPHPGAAPLTFRRPATPQERSELSDVFERGLALGGENHLRVRQTPSGVLDRGSRNGLAYGPLRALGSLRFPRTLSPAQRTAVMRGRTSEPEGIR